MDCYMELWEKSTLFHLVGFFLEYLLKEHEYNSDSAHLSVCILGEFIENHRVNTMVISQK